MQHMVTYGFVQSGGEKKFKGRDYNQLGVLKLLRFCENCYRQTGLIIMQINHKSRLTRI